MTRFLLLVCLTSALAAATVPVPETMPDAQAFAVVVIPNLKTTLARCEQIAELFAPGAVKAGSLADTLGARIDDQGLASLAAGPLVVVLGPGGMAPSIAAIIPSEQPELHAVALRRAGLQTDIAGGLIVVGKQATDIALGKRLAAGYAALSQMAVDGDVRVLIAPGRIIATYRPILSGLIPVLAGQMRRQPNGEQLATMVTLEIQGLLAALDQVADIQIDVDLANQAITSHTLITAVAGSGLASALVAPPVPLTPAPAQRMGQTPGFVLGTGRINGPAINGWIASLLVGLQQTPEGKELITPTVIEMLHDFSTIMSGGFAVRLRAGDGTPMVMDSAINCGDFAALDACYAKLIAMMSGDSAIGQMYAAMGMSATLEHDVRRSGDVAVHRIHYVLDATKIPAGQAEQMRSMMHDIEYAGVAGVVVLAQQPADLDRLVQGGAGEMTTAAAHTFGPDHDGYVDIDYLGMMKALLSSPGMQALQAQPFFAALNAAPAGEPTGLAWTVDEGRALIHTRVPLKPFADLSAVFRQARGVQPEAEQPVF